MLQLNVLGHAVSRLSRSDTSDLQRLYEQCSDYHEMEEGIPTRPDAAEHLLAAIPPGKDSADKHVLGVRTLNGELIGVLDLIRDYPNTHEWWVGLLLLAPQMRGSGLGGELYRATARAVSMQGGVVLNP
jgi:RimJ/RimL family protein N-acetyltransferase